MQCVILVGGLGTRLGGLTAARPKPMLDVAGRPFLERLIDNAARFGADRFLLLAGYLADVVRAHFPNGVYSANGRTVSIDILQEPQPLGTGGALRFARDRLADSFLMLNGDSMFAFNWLDLVVAPLDGAAVGRLALRTVPNAARYGVVRADADGRVASMRQDSAHTGPGDINGGVYWLDRAILDYMEADGFVSLENDVFPRVIADGRLRARRYDGFFIDIGVPDDYARAQDPRLYGRGAVFFDRDGVLNADTDYVHTVEQFRWLEGAREAIRLANDRDLFAFVITNQAGVAHGLYAEAHVRALHRAMQAELRPLGAHIDDFRYCPHHPQGKVGIYRRQCGWRKPEPRMARDLCAHWPVDLSASLLIGDKDSDIAVADALGMRSLRLERDHPGVDLAGALRRALDRA